MQNSTRLSSLQEALLEELQNVLCLEKGLMMALPMMAQRAHTPELQREFERLAVQTREQIFRLQHLMPSGVPLSTARHCEDSWEVPNAPTSLQQALLVAAVQKMQYEKIALYSTACLWAKQLELPAIEQPLAQSLREEEENSQKLLELAQKVGRSTA